MAKPVKRLQAAVAAKPKQPVALEQALEFVKQHAKAKFNESVDVAVVLGVDVRKSDQVVRGAAVLPHGTGKTKRVCAFVEPERWAEAQQAGADVLGDEELIEAIKKGRIEFDVVVATPGMMRLVSQVGQVLGPRGLMPNPKTGTVTQEVAKVVAAVKGGQVQFRTDRGGVVHCPIGRTSFEVASLAANLAALMEALKKAKPAASRGSYLKKVSVSSTMGAGVSVELAGM